MNGGLGTMVLVIGVSIDRPTVGDSVVLAKRRNLVAL